MSYYSLHRDMILTKMKFNRDNESDEIKQIRRNKALDYYHVPLGQHGRFASCKNKDKINEKRKQRLICDCGLSYCARYKEQHLKTSYHLYLLKNK
jgi:hypothetical protein